jgi:hypothetical protein
MNELKLGLATVLKNYCFQFTAMCIYIHNSIRSLNTCRVVQFRHNLFRLLHKLLLITLSFPTYLLITAPLSLEDSSPHCIPLWYTHTSLVQLRKLVFLYLAWREVMQ